MSSGFKQEWDHQHDNRLIPEFQQCLFEAIFHHGVNQFFQPAPLLSIRKNDAAECRTIYSKLSPVRS